MSTPPPVSTSSSAKQTLTSRIRGSFYGLAVTDALGAPVEFLTRGTFPLIQSYQPNTNFSIQAPDGSYVPIPAGSFTDDTSMALCLAHSLIDCNGQSDIVDQVRKYLAWHKHGWMSSVGECFDVGAATSSALKQWDGLIKSYDELRAEFEAQTPSSHAQLEQYPSSPSQPSADAAPSQPPRPLTLSFLTDFPAHMLSRVTVRFDRPSRCGNGSLMRVLPCALIARTDVEAVHLATQSSLPTHPHRRCIDACVIYIRLVRAALEGQSKPDLAILFSTLIAGAEGAVEEELHSYFEAYTAPTPSPSPSPLEPWLSTPTHKISSSGYVLHTLCASLWAFFTTSSFREGAIKVVNLGDDADTVGAVYGGLAGAFYGEEGVPAEWRDGLRGREMVEEALGEILEARGGDGGGG